jgi:5-dehydro-2-deoxygluconokinase
MGLAHIAATNDSDPDFRQTNPSRKGLQPVAKGVTSPATQGNPNPNGCLMAILSPAAMTRFAVNRFVVLGRVGMDLYADPPGTRVEEALRFTAALGGSAGNIAVALARQGAGASLLSCVSDDAVGRYCLAELDRYGVDRSLVRAVPAKNSLAVTETCATECQVVLYRNAAADLSLSRAQVEAVDYAAAAALVVTGTALSAEPSRNAALHAMALSKAAGALTILDLDYRSTAWTTAAEAASLCLRAAQGCDIVIGNDEEFGLIAGGYARGQGLARDFAAGALFTIYKRGAEGSTTFTAAQQFDTPIFPVKAQKPMGAGDGFMGGLLAALAQGQPLPQAVRRGAATAALVVAGVGCAPASPDLTALDRFMAQA